MLKALNHFQTKRMSTWTEFEKLSHLLLIALHLRIRDCWLAREEQDINTLIFHLPRLEPTLECSHQAGPPSPLLLRSSSSSPLCRQASTPCYLPSPPPTRGIISETLGPVLLILKLKLELQTLKFRGQ